MSHKRKRSGSKTSRKRPSRRRRTVSHRSSGSKVHIYIHRKK